MAKHPKGSFQFIDHTADAGILVTAPTLEGMFETAAMAFTELITDAGSLRHRVERRFRLREDDLGSLLVTWLQELLYLLDTEGLVFGRFQVKLQGFSLEARAWGEVFDAEIHLTKTEIKAVTYHQLEVEQNDQGWQARVIFDI